MASATKPTQRLTCAKCGQHGKSACASCLLVLYCGKQCQKDDWTSHKAVCKSPYLKETWQPAWVREHRAPSFVGGPPLQHWGNTKKYLWGNMPALDLLSLAQNEGIKHDQPLQLLFAASGDLRNVIKTSANVPSEFENPITITINDRDTDVVARNIILLLIGLTSQDTEENVDCMLHVWYSAFLSTTHMEILTTRVRPLIEDVVMKIADKPDNKVLRKKTWSFEARTLSAALTKGQWKTLLTLLSPSNISLNKARHVRKQTTLAPHRVDYRDRSNHCQRPHLRLGAELFRKEGILLPLTHSKSAFEIPNPTIFTDTEWPMTDHADPSGGRNIFEVLKHDNGPAINDAYGKLYFHVRDMLLAVAKRMLSNTWNFHLLNLDAEVLPSQLQRDSFARIEVSNISDAGYLGVEKILTLFGPLLQKPVDNPKATLLTLFMNAVHEIGPDTTKHGGEIKALLAYQGLKRMPTSPYDPDLMVLSHATSLVQDVDAVFNIYMRRVDFTSIQRSTSMSMKETHTIIDKWPCRLKLKHSQVGGKEEFRTLLGASTQGSERCVEWKRCI